MSLRPVRGMSIEQAADGLLAKAREMHFLDTEQGREKTMEQFLDKKTFRPGFGAYERKGGE